MAYNLPVESIIVNMFNLNPDKKEIKLIEVQDLAQSIIRFCGYAITCKYDYGEVRRAVARNNTFLYMEDDLIKRIERSTDDKGDKFLSLKAACARNRMPQFVRNAVLMGC